MSWKYEIAVLLPENRVLTTLLNHFLQKPWKTPPEKFLFFVLKSHGENSGKSCQNPGSVGGIEMEH